LEVANWLQRLKRRECIIRRHISESRMEEHVLHVEETKTSPTVNQINKSGLDDLKESLLRQRGIRVRDALEVINRRHQEESNTRPTV